VVIVSTYYRRSTHILKKTTILIY